MAKLKLWIATQTEDSSCYNLIAKTRKELLNKIKDNFHVQYETIGQYEIIYKDAFHLFEWVTGEGAGRNTSYKILSEKTISK